MQRHDRLAVYGHLLWDEPYLDQLGVRHGLKPIGPCLITGALYTFGPAPALVPGEGLVKGFVYDVTDDAIWPVLHAYEDYDPAARAHSRYVLEEVSLHEPELTAALYYWNQPVDDLQRIDHGDWMAWVKKAG